MDSSSSVSVTSDLPVNDLTNESAIFIDVLANDHPGSDDPAEKDHYTVKLAELTGNGFLYEEVNGGNNGYVYRPNPDFLGEDQFSYLLTDESKSASSSEGLVRVWVAKTESLPNVTSLRNFGDYVETDSNWIYSLKMGWVYVKSLSGLYSTTWIWHDEIGWFWTGDDYFAWLFYNDDYKWLHWEGGVNEESGWFLRDVGENRYYSDYFMKRIIRNQVIDILPSLDDLADYVNGSTFFTDSQKSQILRELVFTRKSSTLSVFLSLIFPIKSVSICCVSIQLRFFLPALALLLGWGLAVGQPASQGLSSERDYRYRMMQQRMLELSEKMGRISGTEPIQLIDRNQSLVKYQSPDYE